MSQGRRIVIAGVAIGGLVTAWSLFMGLTGFAFDPATAPIFALVVLYEIIVLVVLLRSTAKENGFIAQVRAGSLAAVIAAPIVFVQSLVFTSVLFADYFAAHPEEGSSFVQAMSGVIGTIGTGIVTSAITAVFARKR
jgi:hypothetical protein